MIDIIMAIATAASIVGIAACHFVPGHAESWPAIIVYLITFAACVVAGIAGLLKTYLIVMQAYF